MKYLDETGCAQWSAVSYSYVRIGTQKRLEQTSRRGQRVSILGVWDPQESFEYALAVGSIDSQRYMAVMDQIAAKAERTFVETQRLTIVVQDNGSIHKSRVVKERWGRWRSQGLVIVFLPSYCSELNPIETEWLQLKTHELAGRMFEYEDELAEAIIDGMIDRSEAGNYALDHLIINCA
ncbi:transposase [Leptolyngbyaceae cyanobacterium CCMR0081]|uniref:Transposase n=1 Tax=Adonisia turfae CCMR0081 TaxID=2292702 RepID=A0A6M0RE17_9CYAN|nr:transposase [Adonisia turfae CCMR0081]